MDVVLTPWAGLAVHHKTVLAGRGTADPLGQLVEGIMAGQACGTLPGDGLAGSDWVREAGVPHGAMERTGKEWQPI